MIGTVHCSMYNMQILRPHKTAYKCRAFNIKSTEHSHITFNYTVTSNNILNSLYQKLIVYETDNAWITLPSGRGVPAMSVACAEQNLMRAPSLSIAVGHWPWRE